MSPAQNIVFEGLLSQGECCSAALQGMANGRTPGFDGLPMEFYLRFWSVLRADLVSCLALRVVVITFSFKNGDRLYRPYNWIPSTLLNVDHKIASRSISACLLKVLHLVLDRDHSYGVPCRFIYMNVAFIRHVVDCCSLSTALFSLDQERAFDRVDWSFLCSILLSMGLAPFLLNGYICFTLTLVVQLMVIVMLVNLFLCHVASVRAPHCLCFCIF